MRERHAGEPHAGAGRRFPSALDAALFVAMLATALALGAALAHAFELPNKIGLPADEYFIVQKAYRGWSHLGWLLAVQFLSLSAAIALSRRRESAVFRAAAVALLCLIAAQIVFWTWTFPANAATANWTTVPENWEVLRRRWEYSHAAGAAFQLCAMIALILGALAHRTATARSPAPSRASPPAPR